MLREMKPIFGRLLPRSAEQFGRDSGSRIRPRHLSCEPLEHRQMLSVTAYAIVDTGQTTFYDNTTVITAPAAGEAFYGQDAQYDGNQASYTLSGDGLTVADDVTGLTWTQSADLDGDGDIDAADKLTYDEAVVYPDTLNALNFGGHSDWRLPSIKELYSLIDFSGVDPSGYQGTDTSGLVPFIDTDYFDFAYGDTGAGERIIDAQMASSTLYVGSTAGDGVELLFGVNFADGRIKGYGLEFMGADKTFYTYFVSGNTEYGENRFVDNSDSTITDDATGLMWSQDDSGAGMNWEEALAWVNQMNDENYLGHDDWRLPNVKELQSIVDYSRSPSTTSSAAIDPALNSTAITNEGGETDYPYYWSGTTHANWTDNSGAWGAYVAFGEASGFMELPPGSGNYVLEDVHGAGAQRSDPKAGDASDYPNGNGPQNDVVRIDNFVRLVRDADLSGDQNVAPTAEASGPYSGQVGDTITLDGSASTDTDGTITAYAWDLDNDGQYDDATGVTASFDASTAGTFTVGLQVTDDDGAVGTDTVAVTVGEVSNASPWTHAEVDDEAAAFFDDSYVHELNITFDNEDWYSVLYESHANDADDPYFEADFECDGIAIASVGVRFKGNSSFEIPGVKKSLKIDFDEYDEDNDDLTFLGLKKLNLNNSSKDPTMLREKLFLDYASNFVDGVSRAVHTNVYINGEYWGLYTAVEQVDKTLVQSRFGSDEDGNLFKGAASDEAGDDPQADFGSDLTWLGSDPELYDDYYQLKTNETEYDYSQLVKFIDVLNNTSSEDLPAALQPILDVDNALTAMALNNLFVNLDSYSGAAHNYYLYDRDDTGQFTHLFWDTNESFGRFLMFTSPREDPLELGPFWLPESMGPPPQEAQERPLMENLWAVDAYSTEYLRDLAEMLRDGFDGTAAQERIDELADLIRDDVYADTNKMYSNAQFEQNLYNNVADGRDTIYGLSYFVEQRSTYLDAELDSYAEQTDLTLNELMSVNVSTAHDESGDCDPWVEIYNLGPGLVDLSGLYLTDDAGNLAKWALPSGNLDDGEFLTLWLDGEAGEGSDHASFSLNVAGGELHLSDGATLIDTVTYDAMADDLSLARVPDGDGDWQSTDRPTPGAANLASIVSIEPVVLYVNEFMADNDTFIEDPDEAGAYEDWIELYNPGTESIDLGGMYLTDDLSDSVQWQIPAGVTIDAGGYLVVWADNDTDQGGTHASFKLSTDGEAIALYNTDGATLIDSIEFGVQTTDVSFGRYPDGTESWTSMTTPTPGATNVLAPTNAAPTAEAGGPYSGQVGDTITLSGVGSIDSDGTIATYAWDLDNDGQYDDATGVTASFASAHAGTFTVGLRITDDDGGSGTDAAIVSVSVGGDMNNDGYVNGLDVSLFVDVLLSGSFDTAADMNDDGEINGLDVAPFVAAVVGGGDATGVALLSPSTNDLAADIERPGAPRDVASMSPTPERSSTRLPRGRHVHDGDDHSQLIRHRAVERVMGGRLRLGTDGHRSDQRVMAHQVAGDWQTAIDRAFGDGADWIG